MKNHGMNPYLPSWEYVPDGEPHVFGKRVYVYGSHDRFAGYAFCQNDYVCWSAPVDDLTDWQYEGIIYTRAEAAHNEDGRECLYAPDVTRGPDGRYYLYYALNETSAISVAVCDTPAGKYTYYGDVHYPDGTTLGARPGDEQQFDPGVLTEGKTTWLYSGFCPPMMPGRTGALCYRLAPDMLTVEQTYPAVVPGAQTAKGTGFEGHAFFEASSIRKVGDKYYFIYSSELSHELCYAVSDSPCRGFVYGGTLVDNADLGLCDTARYFTGNNHGSIEQINGRWYVFYHRHTNSSLFCRQGMVEPIEILPDGRIPQVEITTSGPNGAPLPAVELRELPAYAACNLYMTQPPQVNAEAGQNPFPYITQDGADVMPESESKPEAYICNLTPGTVVGFKYLNFQNVTKVSVKTRGMCYYGGFDVLLTADGEPIGTVSAARGNEWTWQTTELAIPDGILPKKQHPCINRPELERIWKDTEKILAEHAFVHDHKFPSLQAIMDYRKSLSQQMETLTAQRAEVVKQMRRKDAPPELADRRARLTCKIAELRKEDKIAEGAIKRIQRTRESNRIDQENRNQNTNYRNRRRNRSRQR